ncbi:CATL1 protein, partial [Peucedramus taeniatus]|nr:CATL1 protein [Peucedramus taeniatus]
AMALSLGLLLALLGCATDPALEEAWEGWKSLYAKEYPGVGRGHSQGLTQALPTPSSLLQGGGTLGITEFSLGALQRNQEFNELMNGSIPRQREEPALLFGASAALKAPVKVDWRAKGCVTPLKSQGGCGSCWAFSAKVALEGLMFRGTRQLVALSEQDLINCTQKLGNKGCKGWPHAMGLPVLSSERAHPYTGTVRDSSCQYNPATCSGFQTVPRGNEVALMQAVAVDASSHNFQFYGSGIFTCPSGQQSLNHTMLLVGYNTARMGNCSVSHWILKN